MLFIALCSASFWNQSSLALCSASLKTKALFALCSASLKNQSSSCAVLCFFEKPKLFLRCALLLFGTKALLRCALL